MILTVGGDAASKGAQEVMQALALIDRQAPPWKYVCKVWPQARTTLQNLADLELAAQLGIEKKVVYTTNTISRNFMPYLIGACDIYAAPSRLEGFGMPQVEAGACAKPVRHGSARPAICSGSTITCAAAWRSCTFKRLSSRPRSRLRHKLFRPCSLDADRHVRG